MAIAVVTAQVHPAQLDEFVRIYREDILPAAQHMAGFQSLRLLTNRDSGDVVVLVEYETPEHAQAATQNDQTQQFASALDRLTGPITRTLYEVALES